MANAHLHLIIASNLHILDPDSNSNQPYFHHHSLLFYKHHSDFPLRIHKPTQLFNASLLQYFGNSPESNNFKIH